MSHLDLSRIDLAFGSHLVVRQLSLQLEKGRIGCLLGPSGCGKTTVLRCIAGFERLAAGEIRLDGEVVSTPRHMLPPERRRIGMVFQDYALFPHLSVADNIGFGLRRDSAAVRAARVDELLALVGLAGQGHKYPHEMSGGQQQRVALARALAQYPPDPARWRVCATALPRRAGQRLRHGDRAGVARIFARVPAIAAPVVSQSRVVAA